MRQARNDVRHRQDGFTLVELLIVIVILGVLAAIVVIAVGAFHDRGQDSACKADTKTAENAVEAYRAKFNQYPNAGDDATLSGWKQLVDEGFLREPPSTENYTITLQSDGVISSDCANGQAAGGANPTLGGPGGGNPSTSASTQPGGGSPATSTSTQPGGGNPTTSTSTHPATGNPTTTTSAPGNGGGGGGGGDDDPWWCHFVWWC